MGALIFLFIVIMLWYLGAIPAVPPLTRIFPELKVISTLIPRATAIASSMPAATAPAAPSPQRPVGLLGQRTKTSGCQRANFLPDAGCTPGAVFIDASRDSICRPGYSSGSRDVPADLKAEVYAAYGVVSHEPGEYQIDHLVPLALGGSNDIANLWAQPAEPRPGFHEKDRTESYLRDRVCQGALSLRQAQSLMGHNWVSVYESIPK